MKTSLKPVLIILTGICLPLASRLHAQQFNTGLLLDEEGFEQEVEMTPGFSNDGRRAGDLPLEFSLRPFCPKPKNQGEINSCIGWAMGYGALTISHAYRAGNRNADDISDHAFSALYLYNQAKVGNCMGGANIQRTARILKEKGDCKSDDFDSPKADCEREPDSDLIETAQQFAVKDYLALFTNSSTPKEKVVRTKRSLAEGKPVIVGMRIRESLRSLNEEDPVWKPGTNDDKQMGGHALVVVGYSDKTGEFELMNSWGPNWGDGGFFKMKYPDFATYAAQGLHLILAEEELSADDIVGLQQQAQEAETDKKEALEKEEAATKEKEQAEIELKKAKDAQNAAQIAAAQQQLEQAATREAAAREQQKAAEAVIAEVEDRLVALYGEFQVRIPETDEFGTLMYDDTGGVKFRYLTPQWNGSYYTLDKMDWEEGDGFQIIARDIKKDRYVYLFSFDGNEKLEVHWPRSLRASLHGTSEGSTESALVAHKGAEILIPGEDGVLTRENLLDDNICTLYSFDKISDIEQRLNRLKNLGGPFEERLQKAFGDLLIPADKIDYGKDQMTCKTEVKGQGSVIPILVKLQNQ
ncbi:MAG: hypothetical protein EP344_14715 [Bacteroidetes bacterium]|nr:MAG: hypothetical protein EP344_14715 [Bacteroidota bacterium]